jgi:Ca2+-transporting ATPase
MLVLLGAAAASFAFADAVDAGFIAVAIVINAVVGFVQEHKASRALERLRAMVQPKAVVRREGTDVVVSAADVVSGDVLILSAGDQVAADARLLDVADLETNEAALTGESLPVSKSVQPCAPNALLAERVSMVYTGTSILAGRGRAVVVATGMGTELGKIAELLRATPDAATPLQVELSRMARYLGMVVFVLVVAVFFLGVGVGRPTVDMLKTSIALAVAAVPEGLAVSVTVVLAIGMQRILRRHALVRRLVAAETLGSVSVICTDKTGTITEGEMRVAEVVLSATIMRLPEMQKTEFAKDLLRLLEAGLLCNDAVVTEEGGLGKTDVRGTPTERALAEAGLHVGLSPTHVRKQYPRLAEIPFDSSRKYMATLHTTDRGRTLFVKGAPERLMGAITHVLESGKVRPWSADQRAVWMRRMGELTERGLRVLAVAERDASALQTVSESDLTGLTLLGLVALQDPLRSTAKEHIHRAAQAGVRTIIITGDHPRTALAIGQEAGLAVTRETLLTGEEFDRMDEDEFRRRVASISIYARVEPRHKLRIVDAWQAHGAVVAMTGDGVNDAPAIKGADIGIALGSGTEVAKGAADLVLLDNDLGTVTSAIEEGRVMFDNIRKIMVYLMVDSFTEIILIAGALVLGLPAPLLPLQILWINLVADSFPNVGLTLEPGEPGVMRLPPRPRREPVLNRDMVALICVIGVVTDLILLFLYAWFVNVFGDVARAQTIMFAAVGIDSLLYVFAVKSFQRSVFRTNLLSNPWLLGGVCIGLALMALALFSPFFQGVFHIIPLRLSDVGLLLMIGVLKLVVIELVKETMILRKRFVRFPKQGTV